jgi:tRNA pseudouridine38-40 synthase
MPRYRLILEYDGTPFVGWQVQAAGASVQGQLAKAIAKFSSETADVRGAGRTDRWRISISYATGRPTRCAPP